MVIRYEDYKAGDLEYAIELLLAERDELKAALNGLRYRVGSHCFCEMSIGHPLFTKHSKECVKATQALAKGADHER